MDVKLQQLYMYFFYVDETGKYRVLKHTVYIHLNVVLQLFAIMLIYITASRSNTIYESMNLIKIMTFSAVLDTDFTQSTNFTVLYVICIWLKDISVTYFPSMFVSDQSYQ